MRASPLAASLRSPLQHLCSALAGCASSPSATPTPLPDPPALTGLKRRHRPRHRSPPMLLPNNPFILTPIVQLKPLQPIGHVFHCLPHLPLIAQNLILLPWHLIGSKKHSTSNCNYSSTQDRRNDVATDRRPVNSRVITGSHLGLVNVLYIACLQQPCSNPPNAQRLMIRRQQVETGHD
jgi:hypothetical protein